MNSLPHSKHFRRNVDTSERLSLGRPQAGAEFDVAFLNDGRVLLTPMVSTASIPLDTPIPEREEWLYKNPAAMEMVRRGLADLGNGKTAQIELSEYESAEEV